MYAPTRRTEKGLTEEGGRKNCPRIRQTAFLFSSLPSGAGLELMACMTGAQQPRVHLDLALLLGCVIYSSKFSGRTPSSARPTSGGTTDMANEAYHAKKSPLHCTNGAGSLLQLCRRILIESGVVSICLSLSRAPIRRYVTSLVCEVHFVSSFTCSSYTNTPRAEYEVKKDKMPDARCNLRIDH